MPIKASRRAGIYIDTYCAHTRFFEPVGVRRETCRFGGFGQPKQRNAGMVTRAMKPSDEAGSSRGTIWMGSARPRWAVVAAVIAVLFGALTIVSGGTALFGGNEARAAVGNAVPFVLWFNFTAGFAYVLAGVGLFMWRRWAAMLAAAIAFATLSVFLAFGWHTFSGGAFEMRTVGAMAFRSVAWIAIAFASCRALGCPTLKSARQ